jgi:D-alanyl-D-alanine dipeptidase
MRFIQPSNDFVPKVMIDMGHAVAGTGSIAYPDYFEYLDKLRPTDKIAQRNRRIFYWVMRGALTNEEGGFAVNPTEWWHWSYGDQMWAKTTQAPQAFFGSPPDHK